MTLGRNLVMRVLSTLPVMASAIRGWGKALIKKYSSRGMNDEPSHRQVIYS